MELSDDAEPRHREPFLVSLASLQGSSGRTSTIVNLAWMLAAAGRRVLLIDVDGTSPSVAQYLSHLPSTVLSEAVPPVHRYLLPAGLGAVDTVAVDEQGLGRAVERARRSDHDVVLIDHPVVRSAAHVELVATSCDVAVICFRPLPDHISSVWSFTEDLRRASGGRVRIVLAGSQPVGRQVHDPLGWLTRQVEDHRATGPVAHRDPPQVQLIRVPYRPFKVDTALSALTEDPGTDGGLTQAYGALAGAVSGAPLPEAPAVPEKVRRRFLASLRLVVDETPDPIGILYLPRDRPWAEWIAHQIRSAGLTATLMPVDNRALPIPVCPEVVVVTGRVPQNQEAVMVAQAVDRARAAGATQLVSLSICRDDQPYLVRGADVLLQLGRQGEQEATAAVRAALGLFFGGSGPTRGSFPNSGPQYPASLPIRNPDFLGRGAELEVMRDRLLEQPYTQLIMSGGGGTGKSEMACEYAHRFADSYDVVWWVPAHSRQAARQSLAALGALLGDVGVDPASAAVTWLSARDRPWLLIFDNADDVSLLKDLIPRSTTGHVIVTTRPVLEAALDHGPDLIRELPPRPGRDVGLTDGPVLSMPVGRFDDEDALLIVKEWMRSLGDAQAARLAELVGHLPIALRLAVAWASETASGQVRRGMSEIIALNWCVEELARSVPERVARICSDAAAAGRILEDPVTAALLEITLESMETLGENVEAQRSAVRLAQMCAFLSPERVSLELLCSQAMLTAVSDGAQDRWILQDGSRLHEALWVGHRHGVFEVNRAAEGELRMHRMIGSLLRGIMPTDVLEERQRKVLGALTAFVPSDAERETVVRSEHLVELAEHLEPSGALESDDWEVRRWVVMQSRYAYRWGDRSTHEAESERAAAVAARWRDVFSDCDPLYTRLLVQRANLERGLGRARSAHDLDSEALRIQCAAFDALHPRTLISRRGLAADLRGLGSFYHALTEDQTAYEGFRQVFGPDHTETLMAANNLALSQFICGRPGATAYFGQTTADRWRRVYGPGSPSYVKAMLVLAAILRELGRYAAAEQALFQTLRDARSKGISIVDELVLASGRAASRRATGNARDARHRHRQVLDSCRRILGPGHQVSLSVQVALALDHHELRESAEAIQLIEDVIERYVTDLTAGHPFVELCRSNLAVFLRDAGEIARAVEIGEIARVALDTSLDDIHPWTLGADLNQANHLGAAGLAGEALQLRASVTARCVEPVEPEHPVNAKAKAHAQAGGQFAGTAADTIFEVPVL